ncbi:MAG: helix-turn-helix domain-containing protein [Planctomycetes bacterium]|nr:helix-turn-helix domain-containing protein [Planctomycetota bacterium]
MTLKVRLGPALRLQRQRLQLTVEAAARLAHVSPVTLSHLENAKDKDFSLAAVERICEAVGLELVVVVRGTAMSSAPAPALPAAAKRRVRRPR